MPTTSAISASVLALNILTNYFNIVADTDNEFPLVTPHQAA
ncbi:MULTISPECIES: hypothetical protein [Streptomyces]|nr:hypothetical protein [Streptomyces melanosporofaciens]